MNNLNKRILTAIVLVAFVFLTLALPYGLAVAAFGAFMLVGGWEWAGFIDGARPLTRIMYVLMLALLAGVPFLLGSLDVAIGVSINVALVYWLVVLLVLFRSDDQLTSVTTAVAGAFALVPAWFALTMLVSDGYGPKYLLWCVAIVAAADIGAYFTGKRFGRRKLAPSISPGKTIEGLGGGLLAAAIVAAFAGAALGGSIILFAVAGCLIALVSVAGDLWVSRFKRAANLKDSGHILPGHGGIMDRVDGLVAALPLFAFLIANTVGGLAL